MIVVDTGDHYFRDQFLMEGESAQAKRKAQIIADGDKSMGVDVVCPGEADLASGLGTYRELTRAAGVTPICANLKLGANLVLPATAVRVVGDVKIGFFGLMGGTQRPLPREGDQQLTLDDGVTAARAAVEELAGKVDLVVALTHQGFDLDRALAEKVAGIDFILGGHSKESLGLGSMYGKTSIHQAGYDGKYLGVVKIRVNLPGQPRSVTKVSGEAVPMDQSIKDQPHWAKVADDFKKWVEAENAKRRDVKGEGRPETAEIYWGAALCGQCHPKQEKYWKAHKHATAYETLVKKGKHTDPACLPCHTTGFEQARARSEGKPLTDVSGLEAVQCEACHASGSRHNTPEVRLKATRKETCVKCHDAKNSPKFDFNTWHRRAACPPGS